MVMEMKEEKKNVASAELLLRLVVKDEKGRVISDSGQMESKSFVIQFLEFVYGMLKSPADLNATDVLGNESFIYESRQDAYQNCRIDAAINVDTHGIVVGSGDTAEANDDYKLETQLTEGVGAGQITHNACSIDESAAVVGPNVDLIILRSFVNNTGAVRTVAEVGIYKIMETRAVGIKYHCIIRDVLAASVNVPDKCSLSVYYTLRTTV